MDGSRSLLGRESLVEPDDSAGLRFRCQQLVDKSVGFIDRTSCIKLVDDALKAGQTFREPRVHTAPWPLRRPAPTGWVDTFTFGPQAVGASWDLTVAFDSALTTQVAGPHLHVWG